MHKVYMAGRMNQSMEFNAAGHCMYHDGSLFSAHRNLQRRGPNGGTVRVTLTLKPSLRKRLRTRVLRSKQEIRDVFQHHRCSA